MNRQSHQQQPPPPPNMSARHMHGHHSMRGQQQPPPPPPSLQQIGPPPPHTLSMGFPPGPTIPPNMQQRSNRSQNYHNFMDTTNNGVGNVAVGGAGGGMPPPPYMHYNRMSGGNPSANKKYQNPLNKTRSTKYPLPPQANTNESLHQQQHTTAHHQLHGHQQHHQLTSYSNTATVPSSLAPTTTTNPQTAAINSSTNLKILGHENRKQQPAAQAKSSNVYGLKKINENPRQYELNFQTANNERVVNETISSVAATEDLPIKSMKTPSLAEKNTANLDEKEDAAKITQSSGEKAEKAEETKPEKVLEESPSTVVASEANDETNNNAAGGKESNDFKSSREKTPMCLVNDLARFNKISFQYRLTGENGPAHCKRFTVTLKLGDEEYMAEGFKIKEAQHMAAKEAILKTKYKHPIPKANRRNDEQGTSKVNVTPTVELNALAMKLGLQTYYIFDPRQSAQEGSGGSGVGDKGKAMGGQRFRGGPPTGGGGHQPGGIPPTQLHGLGPNMKYGGGGAGTFVPNLAHHNPAAALMHVQQAAAAGHHHHRGGHYPACYPVLPPHMMAAAAQHHHANIFPTPCKITLIVGTQKFIGTGRTIQQAKHDAAAQAIEALKEEMNNQQKDNEEEKNDEEGDNKSPISMVFEIGIKRNLPVDFKILREDGPAHMRTFTTACIVGQIVTEAEGTGKKISKKKAAQKMLEELKKLPPIETSTTNANSPNKRAKGGGGGSGGKGLPGAARKSGGHTKPGADKKESGHSRGGQGDKLKKRERLDSSDVAADASNPITKLVEWCQHNKEKEPIFKVITEAGGKERARQRQFVVEVCTKDLTVRGVGNSKKSARRNAAQNMLLALGVDTTTSNSSEKSPSAQKSDESTTNISNEKSPKAASADFKNRDEEMEKVKDTKAINITMKAEEEKKEEKPVVSSNTTTPAAAGSSAAAASTSVNPTVTSPNSVATTTTTTTPKSSSGLYMKDKLLYLAKLMGFEVDFSDYPKGNHNEFLSIVMISTNPPQICHGIGANAQESQEDAARNALKILSEMGLNK